MSYLPNNVTDCVGDALTALEKSDLLLGDLIIEYSFIKKPVIDYNTANSEARKLVWEYNRIITFIQMVHDYVFEAKKVLVHVEEIESAKMSLVKAGDVA